MSSVKVVVIGCGQWGKNLVRVFSEIGCLIGICDIDRNQAEQISLKYEVPIFDIEEILENNQIDGVVISTTSSSHFWLAKKVLESGKHVFVEKPLALNVKDALFLNALANKEKKMLMVGHILQYHSGYLKLKELIGRGTIGKILYICSKRLNFGRLKREENVLWSLGPHDISMILDLIGESPLNIQAHGKCLIDPTIEDIVWLNLLFEENVQCEIHLSWLNPSKENYFIVIGEKGMLVFDDIQPWEKKVQLYVQEMKSSNDLNPIVRSEVTYPPIDRLEPLKEECLHFIHSIEKNLKIPSDGYQGISVVQVLQAAQHSLHNRSSIQIKQFPNGFHLNDVLDGDDQLKEKKVIQLIDLKSQQNVIRSKIDQAMKSVLDHGIYIFGPEVYRFENLLSNYCGVKYSFSCSNGTDALVLSLLAKEVKCDDAIFLPSFTFAATAEAVLRTGAKIIFIDSLIDTFNMDPQNLEVGIETALKHHLNPRGIITVDLFGQPVDYHSIELIAQKWNLWMICDAAQSFGGSYQNRKVGTIGDITTTSFFPSKPLGCYGDGGAIFTNSDKLASLIKSFRVHGLSHIKYDHIRVGLNSRLDTIQAAILIEKLQIFPQELLQRQINANLYNDLLKDIVQIPFLHPQSISTWAQYTVLLPKHINRDQLMTNLLNDGISSAVYYIKPMHLQEAYKDYIRAGDQPLYVSEELSLRVLSLPFSAYITNEDIHRVCQALTYHIHQTD